MDKRLRVLVVDDEPIVGKRLKPVLTKMGCDVETFENPKAALNAIMEQEYDIVVTDIRMDGVDGIAILEAAKRKSTHTKVIMITGYAMTEIKRQALERGAFDFIVKPFNADDFRKAIAKAAKSLDFFI
ncbi:MAG: response regulator [Nitrospirae bacterium YQR-1]